MAYPRIELKSVAGVGGVEQARYARQLSRARKEASGLERELPYPAEGYSNPARAFRRLGQASEKVRDHANHLSAYIICDTYKDKNVAIGMATAQKLEPGPGYFPADENALELSYWHRDYDEDVAIGIGGLVLDDLVQIRRRTVHGVSHVRHLWMVTIEGDRVKAEVCGQNHFVPDPGNVPRVYHIGDAVTEPRQLWVRDVA